MAKDTTQLVVDFQREQQRNIFKDFEGATALVKDSEGNWVDSPPILSEGKGDFAGAVETEANVLGEGRPELYEEVPSKPEPIPETLTDYFKDGRSEGWRAIIRAGVGAAVARGELSVEEGLETANKELLEHQEKTGELENINFWKKPVQSIIKELGSLSVFQEQILKEAEYHYHFKRMIYYNIKSKKIFSHEAIEDNGLDWLIKRINEENI